MDADERIVSGEPRPEDAEQADLRPRRLADFTGQRKARANLEVYIQAARQRREALDHVLLHGPPGLGKTTLSQIIAAELEVGFKATSGPVLAKPGDLAAMLTGLEERDVLFIDEIHRMPAVVEEVLYSAMEDFHLDLMIGEGPTAKSIRIPLPRFTLVGATTRQALLTKPLQDRFGIPLRLEFYEDDELRDIVLRGAGLLGIRMDADGAYELARRSRGTPRIAGRLLRRVRDFAQVAGAPSVTRAVADDALGRLDIDDAGLDHMDRRYLEALAQKFGGGPVGANNMAVALSEPQDAIEDRIEPYLIQRGLVQRTARGRMLARGGYEYLGLRLPPAMAEAAQGTLFAGR